MPIKSFRALIANETTDTISLHTNTGSTGYRIKKFELIGYEPGGQQTENVVKIFSVPQSGTPTTKIDFSDNTLLGAGVHTNQTSANNPYSSVIIFDNMTFNQDIYITHADEAGTAPVNYYIEVEQIKLDLNENTVATLKDIRNITA